MARVFKSIVVLLFLVLANCCLADSELEGKLSDLRLRAQAQEKLLAESQKDISFIKSQLRLIEIKINTNTEKENNLRAELKKIDSSVQEMNSQVIVNRGKISVLRESFRARVKAIYKTQKGSSVFDYFANSQSVLDALKRKRFLTEIAKADKQLLMAVNDAISALQDGLKQLAHLRSKREETLASITLLTANLNKDKSFQSEYLERKEKQRQAMHSALNQLRSSARELEVSLNKLIDRGDKKITSTFLLVKGSLMFPVKGEVVHGFGKRKHQEFSDFVFSKGIEVKTSLSTEVHAVAAGKVMLARELPGYGMVVILDHGSRVYTLYARIKNLLAQVGDEIKAGEKLAVVENEQNFYFELRKLGKAIDPASFFSN